ncbi:MAG: thiol reductant ABC exporter subunit CydD [Rhodobiaceae bacterium]|nr:thiol reductant ABC exporter subunit CydD [Rhodobiaceae bacterium]
MSEAEPPDTDVARSRLARLTHPVAPRLRLASIMAIVASILWIPQAALVAATLSGLVAGTTESGTIWRNALLFLIAGVVRSGLDAASGRIALRAALDAISTERTALVARESRSSPLSGDGPASAATAALAADKLSAVSAYLTRYRPAYLRSVAVPLIIIAIAFAHSWAVGLILLVAGPLIPVFMALVGMAAREASMRQMDEIGGMNAMLLDRLNALADIRLLNATARVLSGFADAADRLRARTMGVLRIAFLSSAVLELFSAIGVAMVAVYVGFSLLGTFGFGAYAAPLTVYEGVFLLLLAPDFFQPLRDLAAAWHDRAAALAVAGELAALEDRETRPVLGTGDKAVSLAGAPDIMVKGLRYRPPDGAAALTFPDFDIAPGSRIAVTGPSGVGKSTLLALIAGLAEPAEGTVTACGRTIDAETADAWRTHVAWVGQAPHFLNASLRRNIAMAPVDAGDPRLAEAIAEARAGDVVDRLPRGLDTRLGETGSGVSGGEARRLLLARALFRDAAVVLADEPTADLDPETADAVTDALLALADRGATLIVATHDPRLAGRMDAIIDLEACR